MVRNVGGKNVPIGSDGPKKLTGEIEFYDVGKKTKVKIPVGQVTSVKHGTKYKLTAKAPGVTKAGKSYQLHKFSSVPT